MSVDTPPRPVILDFTGVADPDPIAFPRKERREVLGSVSPDATPYAVGAKLSDDQVASLRETYVRTGGNVSETARKHEVDPRVIQNLAQRFEWPVYGTESSESNRRQRQVAMFNKLEAQMEAMLDSVEVETKDEFDLASASKRELSKYLEPLASRHSAFKTVYDAWMRLGTILWPEQFAKDPDPHNHAAQEARSQARDIALLGGVAGLHRSMEEIINRVFIAGVPDRGIAVEAEVMEITRGSG